MYLKAPCFIELHTFINILYNTPGFIVSIGIGNVSKGTFFASNESKNKRPKRR